MNSMFFRTAEEVEELLLICEEYHLELQDTMFRRRPEEFRGVLALASEYRLPISASIFRKNPQEVEKVIKTCLSLGIEPKGSVFKRTPEEIIEINQITQELLGEKPTNNTFVKTPEEVRKILELCINNRIPITGTVFGKSAEELEKSIQFIKEHFGEEFLLPNIIILNPDHLLTVMSYLRGKGLLDIVKNSYGKNKIVLNEELMKPKDISPLYKKDDNIFI